MTNTNGDLRLIDYWRIIWRRKLIVVAFVIAGASFSAAASIFMTDIYRATAVIIPVGGKESGGSELSMVAQQLGGLPGITLPGSRSSSEIISMLNSNIIREKMIEKYNLLPVLFRERWDGTRNEWKTGTGAPFMALTLIGRVSGLFSGEEAGAKSAKSGVPSLWDGIRSLEEVIKVSPNMKDNTITVSAEYKDPEVAERLIEELLATLNERMSAEAKRVAQMNKKYLAEQLGSSYDPIIRQKVFNLIAQQVEINMMAEVKENFAFKVIDPPRAPDRKFKPQRQSIVRLASIASALAGVFAAFIFEYLRPCLRAGTPGQAAKKGTVLSAEEDEIGG